MECGFDGVLQQIYGVLRFTLLLILSTVFFFNMNLYTTAANMVKIKLKTKIRGEIINI